MLFDVACKVVSLLVWLVLVLLGRIVDEYHGPDDLNLVIDLV